MSSFTLPDHVLDAPLHGSANLQACRSLREALGTRPTLVSFVRHLG